MVVDGKNRKEEGAEARLMAFARRLEERMAAWTAKKDAEWKKLRKMRLELDAEQETLAKAKAESVIKLKQLVDGCRLVEKAREEVHDLRRA